MPRTNTPKVPAGVRISQEGLDTLDALAAREGINRSEMFRLLVEYGRLMPEGWRPQGWTPTR